MSFYSRYELVKLVRNGEPKSFQAREIQTGRSVLLHLWGMGDESRRSPLLLRLRDQMRMDPGALMGIVIEVQESAEPPYVVTSMDDGFTTLEEWIHGKLDGAAEPPPLPAPPPPPSVPAPKPEPGEFTRMFSGSPAAEPVAPSVPQAPPAAPKSEPGEFTRLFDKPLGGAEPPKTPPLPAPAPMTPAQPVAPAPQAPHEPGEFTRMFGGPVAQPVSPAAQPPFQPQPSAPPPAVPQPPQYRPLVNETPRAPAPQPPTYRPQPPAASQEGDFAKFFGSPLGANPLPVEEIERGVVPPPPSDPASRPFSGPSDFTIQFGKDQQSAAPGQPPAPPAHSPVQAGATGLFMRSEQENMLPHAQPARPAGPSEFTRVLRGPLLQESGDLPPASPYQSAPMPGAVPLPAPPGKSNVLGILVAVLSFLLILLVITVVVLMLKK